MKPAHLSIAAVLWYQPCIAALTWKCFGRKFLTSNSHEALIPPLKVGWFWTHLDGKAEVWLSWEQSCPWNTWLLFALLTFHKFISSWPWKTSGIYLSCSGNSTHAVKNSVLLQRKSPSKLCGWTERLSTGWGISCDLPYDIWPCFFLWASPHHCLLQSCTIHEELGSALLSWWCGLNKPRRLCQHFKTHFLLQMK